MRKGKNEKYFKNLECRSSPPAQHPVEDENEKREDREENLVPEKQTKTSNFSVDDIVILWVEHGGGENAESLRRK